MNRPGIPFFENPNDAHEAVGLPRRSHISNFDVHRIEELEPSAKRCMPPYRMGFYQISLLSRIKGSELSLDTQKLEERKYQLLFIIPGQVFSWVRKEQLSGYNILFKKEFLMNTYKNLTEDFPFLRMSENNILPLTKEEYDYLDAETQRMESVFKNPHPYQAKILEGMLGSLLFYCKEIHERHKTTENQMSSSQLIAHKFEALVDRMYLNTKNVGDYADELNITPNHLTLTVKKVMGKSAKDIIQNRLYLESKSMLRYSGLDIAEIAYSLNFQEPTHFSRFFKKLSGMSPIQFRNQN